MDASSLHARGGASWRETLAMALPLFKPRIVALLLTAALAGAFLGADGWPGGTEVLLLLLSGGLASAGASALNQYLERDLDRTMRRTMRRPLARGAFPRPRAVLAVASAMVLLPPLLLAPFRPALAFFLLLGATIYVGVYTLWLKPRTSLNIVIGGAAGSAAVMSGGAAVGSWQDPAVLALALLLFLWTPAHFWSLALTYRADYQRAGWPMLSARAHPRAAAFWIALHSLATVISGQALGLWPELGTAYLVPVTAVSLFLLIRTVQLLHQPRPPQARRLFMASNLYLTVVIIAAMAALLI